MEPSGRQTRPRGPLATTSASTGTSRSTESRSPTAASRPVTRSCRPSSSDTRPRRAGRAASRARSSTAGPSGLTQGPPYACDGAVDPQVDHVVVQLDQRVGRGRGSGRRRRSRDAGRPASRACRATSGCSCSGGGGRAARAARRARVRTTSAGVCSSARWPRHLGGDGDGEACGLLAERDGTSSVLASRRPAAAACRAVTAARVLGLAACAVALGRARHARSRRAASAAAASRTPWAQPMA